MKTAIFNHLTDLTELLKRIADDEGHLYQWENDFKDGLMAEVKDYMEAYKITFYHEEGIEFLVDTLVDKYYIRV